MDRQTSAPQSADILLPAKKINNITKSEKIKELSQQTKPEKSASEAKGALTKLGNLALQLVKQTTQNFARQSIEDLINANKQVRTKIAG